MNTLVAWCRRHDWGINAKYVDGNIVGLYSSENDCFIELPADYKTIRAWAGY